MPSFSSSEYHVIEKEADLGPGFFSGALVFILISRPLLGARYELAQS